MEWASRKNENVVFGQEVLSVEFDSAFRVRTSRGTVTADNIVARRRQPAARCPRRRSAVPRRPAVPRQRIPDRAADLGGMRVGVVGGGQSGAEAFLDLISRADGDLPRRVILDLAATATISRSTTHRSPTTSTCRVTPTTSPSSSRRPGQPSTRAHLLTSDGISEATLRRDLPAHLRCTASSSGSRTWSRSTPTATVTEVTQAPTAGAGTSTLSHNDRRTCTENVELDVVIWATGFRPARTDFLDPIEAPARAGGRRVQDRREFRGPVGRPGRPEHLHAERRPRAARPGRPEPEPERLAQPADPRPAARSAAPSSSRTPSSSGRPSRPATSATVGGMTARPPVDVVVVGAGIIGCLIAREMAARDPGATVTVLDRDAVGSGASRRSAGLHCPRGARRGCGAMSAHSHAYYAELGRRHPACRSIRVGDDRGRRRRAAVTAAEHYLAERRAARPGYLTGLAPRARLVGVARGSRRAAWQSAAATTPTSRLARRLVGRGCDRRSSSPRASAVTGLTAGRRRRHRAARHRRASCAPTRWCWRRARGWPRPAWRDLLAPLGLRVKKVVALHIEPPARPRRPGRSASTTRTRSCCRWPDRGHWLFSYTCQEWDVDPDALTAGLLRRPTSARRATCLRRYAPGAGRAVRLGPGVLRRLQPRPASPWSRAARRRGPASSSPAPPTAPATGSPRPSPPRRPACSTLHPAGHPASEGATVIISTYDPGHMHTALRHRPGRHRHGRRSRRSGSAPTGAGSRPASHSDPHQHDETETFVIVAGTGDIVVDGQPHAGQAGHGAAVRAVRDALPGQHRRQPT